jgi:hypothetical protein
LAGGLATTCHGDAAGFLGGIRAHAIGGETSVDAGCSDVSDAIGAHVFGIQRIDVNGAQNEKAPCGRTEGGFWMFLQPGMALKR